MTPQATVGLIAVRAEAAPLLNLISAQPNIERIGAKFFCGHLAHRPVILAQIGPGKVQAAAVAQHLVDRYGADMLISCGSAGAISHRLHPGDVVLADKVVLHDNGIDADNGFQHLGIYDNARPDGLHYHQYLPANPALLAAAQQAAATVEWPKNAPTVTTGCLASGDQMIAAQRKKQWLAETFSAVAVDMEAGAVAQVAHLNHIPWLAIRAISDAADSTIDFNLPQLITHSHQSRTMAGRLRHTGGKVAGLLGQPARLKTIWQLRRAIKRAATHAALVTVATVLNL